MGNRWSRGLLVLGLAVGTLPAQEPPAANPVRIGVSASLSPDPKHPGGQLRRGVELAAARITARGGLLGRPLEIVYASDQANIANVPRVLQELVEGRGVRLIIGATSSDFALVQAMECQERGVLLVTPNATSPAVAQVGDFIFRTCFDDAFQGQALAAYARRELRRQRATVRAIGTSEYSQGLARAFSREFGRLGGEVVVRENYREGEVNFARLLEAMQARQVDLCFVPGQPREAALLAHGVRPLDLPLLGGDAWDTPELYEIGGEALDGALFTSHYALEADSPANRAFLAAYRARFGAPDPTAITVAALGYDTVLLLAEAIRAAASAEPAAVREALGRLPAFTGATGSMRPDQEGNMRKSLFLYRVQDGRPRFVKEIQP